MMKAVKDSLGLAARNSQRVVASLPGVNKNYANVQALRDVDFQVHAGEIVALLGPHGAGKTSALKLLLGLLQPDRGSARVFGGDPVNPENRMRTGAMLQVGRVPETLRVREHIDAVARCTGADSGVIGGQAGPGSRRGSAGIHHDLPGGLRELAFNGTRKKCMGEV